MPFFINPVQMLKQAAQRYYHLKRIIVRAVFVLPLTVWTGFKSPINRSMSSLRVRTHDRSLVVLSWNRLIDYFVFDCLFFLIYFIFSCFRSLLLTSLGRLVNLSMLWSRFDWMLIGMIWISASCTFSLCCLTLEGLISRLVSHRCRSMSTVCR